MKEEPAYIIGQLDIMMRGDIAEALEKFSANRRA